MTAMLDERKTAILSAVVQEYIATALPVGSTHIADSPGVRVSPATVRNEMAVLEQEGYLVQPHTSAGRVPTDKGYRFFVDHLAQPGLLDRHTRATVGDFFASAHGRLEEMLHRTSDLLARLTNYAAVVVGPKAEAVAVRSIQLVGLSSTMATIVAVFGNGAVESETIELSSPLTDDQIDAAGRHLNTVYAGSPLASVMALPATGDAAVDSLCEQALRALLAGSSSEHVYMGGTSAMVSAFDAVDIVRDVLSTLEQQFVIVSLVSDIVNRGMSVAIGIEHGVQPLSACSVVVAPVVVEGEHRGSVGVLGPTRMNYPQALATVEVVSERLGHRLEQTEAGEHG
jgi:heat-inducible transcriptional repressor